MVDFYNAQCTVFFFFSLFSFINCSVIQPGLEKPKRSMETHTVIKGSKNAFAGHLRAKVNTEICYGLISSQVYLIMIRFSP